VKLATGAGTCGTIVTDDEVLELPALLLAVRVTEYVPGFE